MKLYSKTIQRIGLASIAVLIAGFAMFADLNKTQAAISNMLNFAGKVTNVDGSEVTDGNYNFVFSLYNAPSGGTQVWTESLNASTLFSGTISNYNSLTSTYTYTGGTATSTLRIGQYLTNAVTGQSVLIRAFDTVANTITVIDGSPAWSVGQAINTRPFVEGGIIDMNLGSVNSLSGVNFDQPLYLEITFNGETMQPRKIITSVAQAFNADMLDGFHSTDFANLADNSVVTGLWSFTNALSITVASSAPALSITQNGSGDIMDLFNNLGQKVFTVTNVGNVGIGTSTPENKLDIYGNVGIGNQNELRLYELALNGSNYAGFRASSTLSSNLIWTLPTTAGSFGQALMVNSAGDLEWGNPSSGGVNAGTIGQFPYYAANGTTLSATSSIFLDTSGNVGIGTVIPGTWKLNVNGGISAGDTSSINGNLYLTGANRSIYAYDVANDPLTFAAKQLIFDTGGFNESVRIDENGNLSVGTSSPYARLTVWGKGTGSNQLVNFVNNASTSLFTVLENGNIGIGTTSPTGIFTVASSTTGLPLFYVAQNGNIGINTTNPGTNFDILSANSGGTETLRVGTVNGNSIYLQTTNSESIINTGFQNNLSIRTNSADAMYVSGINQFVGIGTTTPENRLDIYGNLGVRNQNEIRLYQLAANGNNYVGFRASSTLSSSITWTLPTTTGTNGQALIVDAAGNLIWGAPSNGSVNAGTTGQFPYYASNGNTLSATSNLFMDASGNIGIGTTTPYSKLTVWGSGTGTKNLVNFVNNASTTLFTVLENGNVGIGSSTPMSTLAVNGITTITNQLNVGSAGSPFANAIANFYGNVNSYLQINAQNMSNGTSASTDYIATANDGTDSTYYLDMGINSSGYTNPAYSIGGAHDSYLYASDGSLAIGTASSSVNSVLKFHTGGTLAANERMRITSNGFVGIGTSSPYAKLTVWGSGVGTNQLVNMVNSASTTLMTILENGNIGIGTTSPAQQLDITKNIQINSTTFASKNGIIYKNGLPFIHDFNYGNNGTVTTNGQNTFIGINSGNFTMGSGATLVTQASYNTGLGYSTLTSNTTGYYNTAIGNSALRNNTSGYWNTAEGFSALYSNTLGYYNTANGIQALYFNTTGYNNVADGVNAGMYISGGSTANKTSNNSLYLGYNTQALADGDTNETVIGASAIGIGNNSVVLGNDSVLTTALKGKVGIGTTVPLAKLHVANGILSYRPTFTNNDVAIIENSSSYSTALNLLSSFTTSSYLAFSNEFSNGAGYIAYIPAQYLMEFSASGTIPLTISGNGNVSIGSSSNPEAPLHVHKDNIGTTRPTWDNTDVAIFENSASYDSSIQILSANNMSSIINFSDNNSRSNGSIKFNNSDNSLAFNILGSEKMRISSTGLVGIGTNNPLASLSIQGIINKPILNIASSTGSPIMYIDPYGRIGVNTSNPDSTLNITSVSGPQMTLQYNGGSHEALFTVDSTGQFTIESNEPGNVIIDPTSKLGIGTTTPLSALTVYGDTLLEGNSRYVNFGSVAGNAGYGIYDNSGTLQIKNAGTNWTNVSLVGDGQAGYIPMYTTNNNYLTATSSVFMESNGSVGIGTTGGSGHLNLGGDIDMMNHNILNIGYLNVGATYGYGLRFNNAGSSSITWGNDSTHQFGSVNLSSMKLNTGALDSGTGVTFGPYGSTPTASFNSNGTMALNGFAFIGGGRITISETSTRASSSILVETSQGLPFLEFSTSTGEIFTFVNNVGWLGLHNGVPTVSLHVGTDNPLVVSGANNAYIQGSEEIHGNLYLNSPTPGNGNLTMAGSLSAGASGFMVNGSGIVTAGTWQGTALGAAYGGTGINSSVLSGMAKVTSGAWSTVNGTANNIAYWSDANTVAATSSIYIANSGNVGIGTSTPIYGLDVYGNITNYVARIYNADTSASSAGLSIRTDGTGNILNVNSAGTDIFTVTAGQTTINNRTVLTGGASNNLPLSIESQSTATTTPTDGLFRIVSNVNTTSNVVFKVDAGGNVTYDGTASSPAADYAEYFYTSDKTLESGDAVCVDVTQNNAVKLCDGASDGNVMGIVSTKAALIGNAYGNYAKNKNYIVVGMLGQVPAKVSDENGSIRPGDSLTSAALPGYVMRANAGDSTVGVALEAFGDQNASGTPTVVSTGKINVLISRRNKSLTVEMVEAEVTKHIADMEIQDEVQIMIANAVKNLNLNNEIQPIVDEQINSLNSSLTVKLDNYTNQITTIASGVDSLSNRVGVIENNYITLAQAQIKADNQISLINQKLILLGTSIATISSPLMVDSKTGLVITDNSYRDNSAPAVSVIDIETATSTEKTAFVVNQLGNGDVVDFQADGVSIVNIAESGKVSIVGEMSIDGRLMVCSGSGCGTNLDNAVDGTMGDMGVEGKVVAGAFESVCADGFVWVPGSAKYGTMPGFCVMSKEARVGANSVPTTDLSATVWTNVSQGEAQLACQAMGDNYHLINENEWLTMAENIIRVSDNDIDSQKTGLQLATASSSSAVNFTLSNGNKVYDLVGSVSEWTDMIVTKAGLIVPTAADWQEYYSITDFKGFNIAPPYYYDSSNGIGRIKVQDNNNTLRGFIRGETSLYDLDLSNPPTMVSATVGFRCAK